MILICTSNIDEIALALTCNRRLNHETRSREQSVDTFKWAAAREDEEVREAENEQWCNRRSVPEYREQ